MTKPKDDLAPAEEWRDAVLDAMVCWEMWPNPGETPKQALNRLLAWEQTVALDPLVSVEAKRLIEHGRGLGFAEASLRAQGVKAPIYPTEAMLDAAQVNTNPHATREQRHEEAREVWARMLKAALDPHAESLRKGFQLRLD